MYEMNEQGTLEQLDYSKMPNAKNLIPAMKYPYGVGHIYSGKVVLYNPKLMAAPTGFADTLDPKHGNKLGIIDIQYQYTMLAAGLASGGTVEQFRAGQGAAGRLQEGRRAHLSVQRGLRPGAQDRGDRLRHHVEGARRAVAERRHQRRRPWRPRKACRCTSRASSCRRTRPTRPAATPISTPCWQPSAQEGFAVDMGYNPTVTNAKVPPDLQKRIGFTDEEQKRLVDLDYGYMAKNDTRLQGMVGQVVQGLIRARDRHRTRTRPRRRKATGRDGADGDGAAGAGDDLRRHLPAGAAGHPVPLQPERLRRRPRRSWSRR